MRGWEFSQSDVFGVFLSFNHVSRDWEFSQSDFFGIGRPGNPMEGPYFTKLDKLLFSFLHLDLWLVEKGHHLEELFGKMGAASREWRPGGIPTND